MPGTSVYLAGTLIYLPGTLIYLAGFSYWFTWQAHLFAWQANHTQQVLQVVQRITCTTTPAQTCDNDSAKHTTAS